MYPTNPHFFFLFLYYDLIWATIFMQFYAPEHFFFTCLKVRDLKICQREGKNCRYEHDYVWSHVPFQSLHLPPLSTEWTFTQPLPPVTQHHDQHVLLLGHSTSSHGRAAGLRWNDEQRRAIPTRDVSISGTLWWAGAVPRNHVSG